MISAPGSGPFAARRLPAGLSFLALAALGLVVSVGTLWAFQRGAGDFRVFYAAWDLALHGRGAEIYRVGPDRYLYAPGFAWLLGWLAWLPYELALALWCFGKAAGIGFVLRELSLRYCDALGIDELSSFGAGALGILCLSRPLLIDFQYGQVNTYILVACAWALLGRFDREAPSWRDALRWAVLAAAALAKLFPLPLLLAPWAVTAGVPRGRLQRERWGSVAGLLLVLALPVAAVSARGAWELMLAWANALATKGFPLESHNQGFGAFLSHYFSGKPVHFIFMGPEPVPFGLGAWLSDGAIRLLTAAWAAASAGAILALLLLRRPGAAPERDRLRWSAALIALLILPSHLVWKPYFVLCIPLGVAAVQRAVALLGAESERERGAGVAMALALLVAFAGINLSGFDAVGPRLGAWLEAGSLLLWMELLLLAVVAWPVRSRT